MREAEEEITKNRLLRSSAMVVMSWERLWPLLVPLFIVASIFIVFSWVGGWRLLAEEATGLLTWSVRIGFIAGSILSLWPLRQFVLPTEPEITRRIEKKSGLEHRPITAQSDEMATGRHDGFAKAVWEEHRRRMSTKLQDMTAGAPAPNAGRFDPFAFRTLVPLLVFAAFFFSFSSSGGRISDVAGVRSVEAQVPIRLDAWLAPPSYTRKSPIFLTGDTGSIQQAALNSGAKVVTVPERSEFFLRFIGEGDLKVMIGGAEGEQLLEPNGELSSDLQREFSTVFNSDSVIRLEHKGEEIAQWGISLIPDQAPVISFLEDPRGALSGSLQLTYKLEDDYGISDGEARVVSRDPVEPGARPLVDAPKFTLTIPKKRGGESEGRMNKDLTDHPWAGSDVSITLEVTDAAGQKGTTGAFEMVLPGRRFSDPLALALVEQRRILALDANRQGYVANLLDAVSTAAPEYIEDDAGLMGMRVAYRRLVDARNDEELRSVLDLLWEIALGIEFGNLSEAEQRLREAQERLSEALENGASNEEIDRLMQELREAMNEMMQALAEQMRQNPSARNPFENQNTQTLTQNDLERMMDRIEDLAKSGSKDAARQMLSELQRMMDNLRSGRHEQQRNAEGNQLNQALDKMSELMQRQQELMDESFRMQRERQQLRQGQQQQGQQQQGQRQGQQQQGQQQGQQQSRQRGGNNGEQGQQGQSGQMTPEEFAEALRQLREQQQALSEQLGQLGEQLEQLGIGQPQELGEAQEEMGQAGDNLGQGEPGSAAQNQGNALEALRRGAQNMMEQMAGDRQQGGQQQSENGGQGEPGQRQSRSDPLGRESGSDGFEAGSDVEVPGLIDAQRARRILEAIRDRLAIPDNPLLEKDYLERLLETE